MRWWIGIANSELLQGRAGCGFRNVTRILVGVNDMEDDSAFKALDDVAKGMGLL